MSSVGVMTFLHNDNYGSSLQAYALQQAIREYLDAGGDSSKVEAFIQKPTEE